MCRWWLQISTTVLHVGEWIDLSRDGLIPRLTQPGFTVVNVAANYTVNQHATAFVRIDNLFDERYQDPTGFLRPGIGAFGGIRLATR